MKKLAFILSIILVGGVYSASSQVIDDGVRYTNPDAQMSPRVGALGISYFGISDDGSALFYNPAGMQFVKKSELSVGFGLTNSEATTNYGYFNTQSSLGQYSSLINNQELQNFHNNSQYLTNLTYVTNIKDDHGKSLFGFGIGYVLEKDYNSISNYQGFNPRDTYINYTNNTADVDNNWALKNGLVDTLSPFKTPYKDSLLQNGFEKTSGGLHNITSAISFKLTNSLNMGISLTGKWGNYQYSRVFTEEDSKNKYKNGDGQIPFGDLFLNTATEYLNQDVSGFTMGFSLMGKVSDFLRYGVKIQLPTWYSITETWGGEYLTEFDKGSNGLYPPSNRYSFDYKNEYKITTPFVYSAGASGHILGATLSAAIEIWDDSQLSFGTNDQTLLKQISSTNIDIAKQLWGQVKYGIGAEYELPALPVILRASLQKQTSPSKFDKYSIINWALGCGIIYDENVLINIAYNAYSTSEFRSVFGGGDSNNIYYYKIDQSISRISLGIVYRY